MKRIYAHIIFWLCYIALCMFMEYLWVSKAVPDMATGRLLPNILLSVCCITLPEILFSYYLMYRGYERLIDKRAPAIITLLEISVMVLLSLTLIRIINYYLFAYVLYDRQLAEPAFFDAVMVLRSLIYLGFSSGLAVSVRLFRKQLRAIEREKDLMEQKLNAELKALRGQLHPHFLFNTLNNIYALTRKKSDQAPEAVMKLSELLSFMLYKSDQDTITITQEIAFLEDYIALEKIRYGDRLSLSFGKDVDNTTATISPLILLPLVENAFKHGAGESRLGTEIKIAIQQKDAALRFAIENSFEQQDTEKSVGKIGLQNVRRQLELLYKDYTMEVSRDKNIHKVELYINLDSYGKA